ncbi:MAG TPA: hypothetical protein VFE62_04865 [Gemmataceae bacterium]|nr:hypothetical protein [Gemmataceae bacterium]
MSERCAKCGEMLVTPLPAACPACKEAVAGTAITEAPISMSERPISTSEPEEIRDIAKPEAMGPPCPGWLLVGLSTLLCGGQGALAGLGRTGKFDFRSDQSYLVGVAVGLAIGLVLAIDHWRFRKELNRTRAVADDGTPVAPAALPSEAIPVAMLILPILAAFVMWAGPPLPVNATVIEFAGPIAMIGTSVLGYFSIRQIALYAQRSQAHTGALSSPAFMYLAMLALWLICYPVHFVIRARMGGRNLVIPGLIATGVYCLQIFQPLFVEPELPGVDNSEVRSLLKQLVEQDAQQRPATIKNTTEVSFDAALQKRVGRCLVATKKQEEEFTFTITWQKRAADLWQVTLLPQLPPVDAPEVTNVLRDLLAGAGHNQVMFRNPVQETFDSAKQIRIGRVTAVLAKGEAPVRFRLDWESRDKGAYLVNIIP